MRKEGVWKWQNGESWKYTNWRSGEPNNGLGRGQEYLQMYCSDGTWDDFYGGWDNYTEKKYFICEWSGKLKLNENLVTLGVNENTVLTYTYTEPDGSPANPAVTWKSSNGAIAEVSSEGEVFAVSPGTCTITCITNKISRKVSVIVLPQKITGLKAQTRSRNALRLAWNAQSGVSKYEVYMYDPAFEEYTLVKTVSGTKHAVKISGLEEKTKYRFKVRAYISFGSKKYYGSYSKVLKAVTK